MVGAIHEQDACARHLRLERLRQVDFDHEADPTVVRTRVCALPATLKHAHHNFDVDQPGKDSYEHRKSGACEVIVSSARRWVQMHEIGDGTEATLSELLRRLSPCDLVLVEGFKHGRHPKLEVFPRRSRKNPAASRRSVDIVAVGSDQRVPGVNIPVVDLNDIEAVAKMRGIRAGRAAGKVLAALAY